MSPSRIVPLPPLLPQSTAAKHCVTNDTAAAERIPRTVRTDTHVARSSSSLVVVVVVSAPRGLQCRLMGVDQFSMWGGGGGGFLMGAYTCVATAVIARAGQRGGGPMLTPEPTALTRMLDET